MSESRNNNQFIGQIGQTLKNLADAAASAAAKGLSASALDGSVAADEQDRVSKSNQQSASLLTVKTTCLELLESGMEHVQALGRITIPDSLILASATCVRSTLEPCALVLWLLDSNVDEQERIGRVLAFRYAGQEESRKFAKSANLIKDERHAKDRINEIINDANGRGYRILKNRQGKKIGVHIHVPSTTNLIDEYLDEEELYRLLSAVAHGHEWAIRSFAFQQARQPTMVVDGVPATAFLKRRNDPRIISWLAIMIAKAFSMAAIAYGNYLGWEGTELDRIRSAEDELLRVVSVLYSKSGNKPHLI